MWAINTTHLELKNVRTATMHVYWYTQFHVHTACLGGPGAGKSKVMHVNMDRLIPGTYRDVGSETAKAKMVPGNKNDIMIEFFEDVPPAQLGIASYKPGAGAAQVATSHTDGEALLKYRLTKGRIKGAYKAVLDGKHMTIEIDSWCNTVMIVGMNSALAQIPLPISSRFNNLQFLYKNRGDASGNAQGLFGKYQADKDPMLLPARKTMILRDQRRQLEE